jgi:hypothetical protein
MGDGIAGKHQYWCTEFQAVSRQASKHLSRAEPNYLKIRGPKN